MAIVFVIAMTLHFIVLVFYRLAKKEQVTAFYAVIPIVSLIISYLIISSSFASLVSNKAGYQTSNAPLGFNAYVGMNTETSGTWNIADSEKLDEVIAELGYDAQSVHNRFMELAAERFGSLGGIGRINLLFKKHNIMWGADTDVLMYTQAGIGPKGAYLFRNVTIVKAMTLVLNTYYMVLLIFAAAGVILTASGFTKDGVDRKTVDLILVYIILAGFISAFMIVEVSGRYHVPMISLFAILGAAAFRSGGALFSNPFNTDKKEGDSGYGK